MNKKNAIQCLLGGFLGLLATQGVAADNKDDFYLSLGAGFQKRSDASDSAGTATFDNGSVLSGAVGYRINAFRIELEGLYLSNDLDTENPNPTPLGDLPKEKASGDVTAKAFMANLYHDFQPIGGFRPYAGLGLGMIKAEINGLTTPGLQSVPPPYGPILVNSESDWGMAFQVKLGASYALGPNADVFVGYRYLRSKELDFFLDFSGETIHPRVETNSLEMGLKFTF